MRTALTVFCGGRIQWCDDHEISLLQEWTTPHLYASEPKALQLWTALLEGNLAEIRHEPWIVGQTKFCPVCGHDLSNVPWWPRSEPTPEAPLDPHNFPFDVPYYEICGGCNIEFGVDWRGASFDQMRKWWLDSVCPWWRRDAITEVVVASRPTAMADYRRIEAILLRTPTDHPYLPYSPPWQP